MVRVLLGFSACSYVNSKSIAGVVAILERHITRMIFVKFRPLKALAKQCLSQWRVEPSLLTAVRLFCQTIRELFLQELRIELNLLGHRRRFCFISSLVGEG